MNYSLFKKNSLPIIKRVALYAGMTLAVFIIVTFVILFILGYRFDSGAGRLEQYALLQLSSTPSGATVTIDGKTIGSQTPNKSTVRAGQHTITMTRSGYETWRKTINVKSGVLEWLNYAVLVPKKLTVESVASYDSIFSSIASPGGQYMLIQDQTNVPNFDLVNLSSDTTKITKLIIPADVYSEPTTPNVTHAFQVESWDDSGRYVLIKHTYNSQVEWLVLDTQDVTSTKNITSLFDVAISKIIFSGTSGTNFYALVSGDIRKLDLLAGTISRPLASNVTSFSIYGSGIITYIGAGIAGTSQQVVGLYRDGDEKSYTLKTIDNSSGALINVAAARYFNEDYVAISIGNKLDILGGSYPNTSSEKISSLKTLATLTLGKDTQNLSFSPTGEYVLAQSGSYFASYDLEYQTSVSSSVEGNGNISPLRWLNDNYVLSDRDGNLTIREFDGDNIHTIDQVSADQGVTMTSNGRYIYSVNKLATGYQLQRVRMILP
jgi:hypothetical protein